MKVEGKTLALDSTLWVQYGGVSAERREDMLNLTATGDDAYVKVLNHFGRLLRLYTFEDGRWVDAETGGEPAPFDEREAGRLTAAGPATKAPPPAKPARSKAPKAKPAGTQKTRRAKGGRSGNPAQD